MGVNKLIQEELERYANINGYVDSLEEQHAVGGLGATSSGFVQTQGKSDRLEKFNRFQRDMEEQEEETTDDAELELDDEGTDDELDLGDDELESGDDELESSDDELDLGDDELDLDVDTEESDVEKLDVTDIVTMTKETGEKADTVSKEITSQSKRIEDLIGKLDALETQLGGMDKIVTQMNSLENKFEELKPETPQEKLELRYLDSGPFTQTPSQFWDEKGEELEKQPEKHEYVLTSDDVSDYNDADIKNSWLADDDDDEEELEDEKFSVLGNKS